MQIHIFKGPGRIFGVTTLSSGENLPRQYAPWTAFRSAEIEAGQRMPGLDVDDCLQDLQTHGVHVTDAHVRITEEALRRGREV